MKHVMLDLETWGTTPGSDLRSIGAVVFDFENGPDLTKTFYVNVAGGGSWGLRRDPATERWWSEQSTEAQEVLWVDQRLLLTGLLDFTKWFNHTGAKTVWSHGALFDVGLIEAAFRACLVTPPWDYRASRDTRTVFEFFPAVEVPFVGVKHNALDDAVHQARWIVESVKAARRRMVENFLRWPLPENFNPDGGVSFDPAKLGMLWPTGTNLLNYSQASEMVNFMIDGAA